MMNRCLLRLSYLLFVKLTVCTLCGQVLKESFKLYRAINDGIINLVDKVSAQTGFSEFQN